MQELLSYNISGIPLVFWGFLVALVLTMHYLASAVKKEGNQAIPSDDELVTIPFPTNDVAIR